jgi:hypothetical protein
MVQSKEARIEFAIQHLENEPAHSRRAIARAYGVSPTTLHDRMNGAKNAKIAHQHRQRLTSDQEDFLANWILEQDH